MSRRRSIVVGTISGLALLGIAATFAFLDPVTAAFDYWRLRNYTPPAEIAAIADNTTMVDSSRRLFYVYRPAIADGELFNDKCREEDSEFSIVLGCYIQNDGIYLLDVNDPRLSGIKEVTAAHELLHAAYERLDSRERKKIDELTASAYDSLVNERIRKNVEQYRRQNPAVVPNELHSILGTEVGELPEELEAYYEKYFRDRQAIVRYSDQYEQAFIERRNAVREYDAQLTDLKSQIDALEANLIASSESLQNQRSQMDSLRASGQTEAYNQQVPTYNSKINQYNRDVDRLTNLIVQYNDIVQKRNDIAAEEAELVEAIDSREVVPRQQ